MNFEMIAIKCKHWERPPCPHRDKKLLRSLLLEKGTIITSNDIIEADTICKSCSCFEQYKFI
jgi:hypothetical protein